MPREQQESAKEPVTVEELSSEIDAGAADDESEELVDLLKQELDADGPKDDDTSDKTAVAEDDGEEATGDDNEDEGSQDDDAAAEEEPPEAKAEGDDEDDGEPDAEKTGDESEADADQTDTGQDSPLEPPARFSETDKTVFNSLPREGQDLLLRRHKEMEATPTAASVIAIASVGGPTAAVALARIFPRDSQD